MPLISQSLILLYSAGPTPAKVTQVANLQQAIRRALGDDEYQTFLQGSYRNDTGLLDINDVDIVARRKGVHGPLTSSEWENESSG